MRSLVTRMTPFSPHAGPHQPDNRVCSSDSWCRRFPLDLGWYGGSSLSCEGGNIAGMFHSLVENL